MIRPTTPADTAELVALTAATGMFRPIEVETLKEVFADYFREEQAAGHRSVTLVADDGSTLLGFAYYAPAPMTDRSWQLWWIVVRKDTQARGLGTQMLRYVEEDIRRQQGRLLFIETGSQPHYEPTRRFYLKHDYEQHALLKDFYAAGDSMVVFRKEMNPASPPR